MNIKYEAFCEIGSSRSTNQDNVTAYSNNRVGLFAVADGAGGHSNGEYASKTVIEELNAIRSDILEFTGDFQKAVDITIIALKKANESIYQYTLSKDIICASTATVLLIYDNLYAVVNIGDSPVYHYDGIKGLHESTEHYYENIIKKTTLFPEGEILEDRKGRLVRAIGINKDIHPSVRTGIISRNELFFICSDGISRYFSDKQIFSLLKQRKELSDLTAEIKNKVYEQGAEDNLSGIIVNAISINDNKNVKAVSILIIFIIILAVWIIINFVILGV